ncbi:restriction endonuclease subunit S [Streptococcus suis]|uniref:restriction endonuclease subunit S n=1 Tax=Streptococcus suis TaxID=1307 RepID=UPI0028C4D611|nr:restriction endonuclease subunit S [Streptococcus suis]WNO83768.1 restriction endonuclease subunit S [Streptococcus suis]
MRKLGEIASFKKGPFGSALKKAIFIPKSSTSVKVYEQQNAINKDWKLERYYISKDYAETLETFKVRGGDIIVSCAGTIGELYELPLDAEIGVINQALMRIRISKTIVDGKIFQILFSNMIDDFSQKHSNGSAMKNIPPFSDLKRTIVKIPSTAEQSAISTFFSTLDQHITLHQRKS